ncbi:YfhE family protein [Aneurinibacillus migulanus]|uniref:YfhE family protein n=1 Tax=Aneurinibacillus migulanus TaxID=47500 RepID=UPI002E238F6C|nr:YfhE family protein [Aneurinibacillus migulanus]
MNDKHKENQYHENLRGTQEVLYNEEFKKSDAAYENAKGSNTTKGTQQGYTKEKKPGILPGFLFL